MFAETEQSLINDEPILFLINSQTKKEGKKFMCSFAELKLKLTEMTSN